MGGSAALALRGHCAEMWGLDANPVTEAAALANGVIDRVVTRVEVLESDVLLLAAPVRAILSLLGSITNNPFPFALANRQSPIVLLDFGSTKRAIVAAMENLPAAFDPLGGHPMGGKEVSGLAQAEAALFQGKTFVLTPLARTSARALALAHELIAALGAQPLVLDAAQHDRLAAYASHLPYLVAVALVNAVLTQGDAQVWDLAASGFRDTSRLAASDLTMMVDILLTNREAVLETLAHYRGELDVMHIALTHGDETALRQCLLAAYQQRKPMFGALAVTQ
jgi:prephenate dehydrogenase